MELNLQYFKKTLFDRISLYRGIPPAVIELYSNVKSLLPEDPIVVEAGAHMGYDTLGLAKIWPKGRVYAFEPVPALFNDLQRRLKNVRNTTTFNLALGSTCGFGEMHVSGGTSTASSSILQHTAHLRMFPGVTFEKKVTVPIVTLADWARKEKVDKIDLVWLDMQGYEVRALEGAGELLNKTTIIYTELCKTEYYSGLVTQDSYIRFLETKGFKLVSMIGEQQVNDGIFVNTQHTD